MKKLTQKARIGVRGERLAARYLRRHGYRILARNVHCGKNELDLVARNRQYIVFAEVKTRSFDTLAQALEHPPALAVDTAKRQRTLAAAREYLRVHPTARCPRMDVIEVCLDRQKRAKVLRIHHIEGAFDARGRSH
jgi:putative endonuclease